MADLCVHEMDPASCSWCSGRDGGEAAERARIAELRETWRGWRADYPGRCALCGGPIVPGDPIKTVRAGRGWRGPCCITEADLPRRPVL